MMDADDRKAARLILVGAALLLGVATLLGIAVRVFILVSGVP